MPTASFTVQLRGPDPLQPVPIYQLAEGFFLAGGRCLAELPVAPGLTQCLVSPGVVNLCLSIELFCKSLIVAATRRPAPKTHRLVDLFRRLPPALASEVEQRYAAEVPSPALPVLLDQANEYFVRVRYGHEFNVFSFAEHPIFVLASVFHSVAAREHGIKVGIDRIRV